uniref:Vacuolar ATPase assembly protein VMA22 n=1 Tax=Latimeria chalumnae TaxID=7897 RepID=H2ZUT9_LATCH
MGVEEDELSGVCEKLDGLVLQFMKDLETLEKKRGVFNSLIEQGWFSLSKSRYAMGNKSVSSLQYGPEMNPLVWLHTRAAENGTRIFEIERKEPEEPEKVEDIGPKEPAGVRRRKLTLKRKEELEESGKVPDQKPENPDQDKAKTSRQNQGQPPSQDPLKWFGILVPQSLKQAQASFKHVIELSAEIAALQSSIESQRMQYWAVLQEKRQAEASPNSSQHATSGLL